VSFSVSFLILIGDCDLPKFGIGSVEKAIYFIN